MATAPIIRDPAKLRALVFLLRTQPSRQSFLIDNQEYSRTTCYQILLNQVRQLKDQQLSIQQLIDSPQLLDQLWDFFTEALIAQTPEPSRPSLDQLNHWQRELLRHSAQTPQQNQDSPFTPLRAETLSVAQQLELIKKIQTYEELKNKAQGIAQKAIQTTYETPDQPHISKDAATKLSRLIAEKTTQSVAQHIASGQALIQPQQAQDLAQAILKDVKETAIGKVALSTLQAQQYFVQQTSSLLLAEQPKVQALPELSGLRQRVVYAAAPTTADLTQQIAQQTGVSQGVALRARLRFEQNLRSGFSAEAALIDTLNSLQLSQQAAQLSYQTLEPFARDYQQTQFGLNTHLPGDPSPQFTPLPRRVYGEVERLNNLSQQQAGPAISATAYTYFGHNVTPEELTQRLQQNSTLNPSHTHVKEELHALSWLQEQKLAGRITPLGLPKLQGNLEQRQFNSDTQAFSPLNKPQQTATFTRSLLDRAGAGGLTGWITAPHLKVQEKIFNLAISHPKLGQPLLFLSNPKQFIAGKFAGAMLNFGSRWAIKTGLKGLVGKGIAAIGAKLAGTGVGKLLGGVIGTAIGGPVGTAIGLALGALLEKAPGFLKRNGKKLLFIAGAFQALIIGLIAKIASALPLVGMALGVYLLPLNPFLGALSLGLGAFGLARQIGTAIGKGGLSGALGSVSSSISSFLGLSSSATIPAYVMVAPFAALGGLVVINIFSLMALSSAFVLPPTAESLAPGGSGMLLGWPTSGRVTQGPNTTYTHKDKLSQSIDIANEVGTPVSATHPGVVTFAAESGGYGNLVEIRSDYGFSTRYAHLETITVAVGQRISVQQIGTMGNNGRSDLPHLHYEIRNNGNILDTFQLTQAQKAKLNGCLSFVACGSLGVSR